PLIADDIQALAQQISSEDSDFLSDWLIRHTEGNPYFLTELIHYARREGWVGVANNRKLDIASLKSSTVIPQTVQNLIQSRLSRLSDDARRGLELAAVLGRKFTFDLIAQVLSLSENAILDAFDELQAAVLIKAGDDEQYSFDHSLTMEVVYQGMTEARYR